MKTQIEKYYGKPFSKINDNELLKWCIENSNNNTLKIDTNLIMFGWNNSKPNKGKAMRLMRESILKNKTFTLSYCETEDSETDEEWIYKIE